MSFTLVSVKVTESVNPSEIPLPDVPMGAGSSNSLTMGLFGLRELMDLDYS